MREPKIIKGTFYRLFTMKQRERHTAPIFAVRIFPKMAYLSENDMLSDKVAVGSNGKILSVCTATEKSAIKAIQKNIDK